MMSSLFDSKTSTAQPIPPSKKKSESCAGQKKEEFQHQQSPQLSSHCSVMENQRNHNVDPYLSITNYQSKGSELRLKDNTEFYVSGSVKSKKGIIMISDIYGWNGGRVRNICDFFGDNGTFCVIPNFLSFEEGVKGVKGVKGESK
jgi:hypothetical protein